MKTLAFYSAVLSAVLLVSPVSFAEDWGDQLVLTKKVDFGVIATGSEAKKYVEVHNIFDRAVHISNVRTTCGCSAAALGKQTLQPGEKASVEVKMNTSKFRQRKDSNLIITFDKPRLTQINEVDSYGECLSAVNDGTANASATFRNGGGGNPANYAAAGGPVLGGTYNATSNCITLSWKAWIKRPGIAYSWSAEFVCDV